MSKSQLAFWKPYQGKGSAFVFNTSINKEGKFNLFLQAMPEKEDGRFNSDARINFKLGLNDVADMLTFLNGGKDGLGTKKNDKWGGLFHKTPKGNSALSIDATDKGGFSMRLSTKPIDGTLTAYSMGVSLTDMTQMKYFLECCIREMFVDEYSAPQDAPSPAVTSGKGKTAPPVDDDEGF